MSLFCLSHSGKGGRGVNENGPMSPSQQFFFWTASLSVKRGKDLMFHAMTRFIFVFLNSRSTKDILNLISLLLSVLVGKVLNKTDLR